MTVLLFMENPLMPPVFIHTLEVPRRPSGCRACFQPVNWCLQSNRTYNFARSEYSHAGPEHGQTSRCFSKHRRPNIHIRDLYAVTGVSSRIALRRGASVLAMFTSTLRWLSCHVPRHGTLRATISKDTFTASSHSQPKAFDTRRWSH